LIRSGFRGDDGPMSNRLSFAVSIGRTADVQELTASVQRAEAAGADMLTVADHLGSTSPFQVLAAAAAVSSRVRLRTYVLDAYFWNPALLAREVATLDSLSGGRFELGIGAGHMRHEHEQAGLPFPGVDQRWSHVEQVVTDVRGHLADPEHEPAVVQRPVPVMIAAMGERGLDCAARMGDVVGLSGLLQVPGQRAGMFTVATAEQVDERVSQVRRVAAGQGRGEPVLDALVQEVSLSQDPERAAEQVCQGARKRGSDWFTPQMLLTSPFFLFSTSAAAAASELVRRSQRWGITSWSTHGPSADALLQVAAAYRGSAA